MQRYLTRNWKLSKGLAWDEDEPVEGGEAGPGRPATADSIGRLMEKVKLDRAPTVGKEVGPSAIGNGELDEKRSPAVFTLPEE